MGYNSWEGKKPKRGKFASDNSTFTIKSDLRWKQFRDGREVPKSVLESQFDHLDEDQTYGDFFEYNGYWYHITDFMRTSGDLAKLGWNGYSSDSYFSGVVVAFTNDGEEYIVGTYMS